MNKNTTIDISKIEIHPFDKHVDDTWKFGVYYKEIYFEVPYSVFCIENSFIPIDEQEEIIESHICLKDFEGLADTIKNFIIDMIKEYM